MSSNLAPLIAAAVRRAATEQEERRRLGMTQRTRYRSARHPRTEIDEEAVDILARTLRRGARGRQLVDNLVAYAAVIQTE